MFRIDIYSENNIMKELGIATNFSQRINHNKTAGILIYSMQELKITVEKECVFACLKNINMFA